MKKKILAVVLSVCMLGVQNVPVSAQTVSTKGVAAIKQQCNVNTQVGEICKNTLKGTKKLKAVKKNNKKNVDGKAIATVQSVNSHVSNKYCWNNSTAGFSIASLKWSDDQEIYSTYPKTDGFAASGSLFCPKSSSDFKTNMREGYLTDSEYQSMGGHFYTFISTGEENSYITSMLESNVGMYIFDSEFNLIYRSVDQAGNGDYIHSYYNRAWSVNGVTNNVYFLGLNRGEYYIVFARNDDSVESNSHYAYIAGQPLPMKQTYTSSELTHNGSVAWDQRSYSSTLVTHSVTIDAPDGAEDEFALTEVRFNDLSKSFANERWIRDVDYYYTCPGSSYYRSLTRSGGVWGDQVDYYPSAGSIEGTYRTKFTVNWDYNLSYVNATCYCMTRMNLEYVAPFGIIVG